MVLTPRHIDNGHSRLGIAIGDGVSAMQPGLWRLQIRNKHEREQGEIHAWIERGAGVPSSFVNHVDEEMTLSIPGTAQSVITVGAVDAVIPITVGYFSSYGPTRDGRLKPEVAAPGVSIDAARGGTANDVRKEDGTSMAAPHVTGAIALLLSRTAKSQQEQAIPTATQIARCALPENAQLQLALGPRAGFRSDRRSRTIGRVLNEIAKWHGGARE